MSEIIQWANANEGFLTLITAVLIPVFAFMIQAALAKVGKYMRSSVAEEEIIRVERIRAEFYNNLKHIDRHSAYGPFLIRDIARDLLYFDGDESSQKSGKPPPSYKVQLVDMSVFGVRVYHGWPQRIKRIADDETWCLADDDEFDSITVHPIGVIPFSSIVAINWHGDPAHTYPHIFCRFDGPGGWPYKKFEYCECKPLREGWELYIPVVDADLVIKRKF